LRRARPIDGIAPSASRCGVDDYVPLNLPPENPFLLRAFPYPVDEHGRFQHRPACLIFGASRVEHERQRRTAALADAIAFELAVAENTLILHPDDADAAAVRDVLCSALPAVTDRRTLPPAVTR
jgi:hypothetical protein